MKKELVPTVFNNSEGTYLRLEFFKDNELVDRITLKVDKNDEELLTQFFIKYNA